MQLWSVNRNPAAFNQTASGYDTGRSAFSISDYQAPPANYPFSMKPFEKYIPYFGLPSKPWIQPYDSHDVQHEILPQAYEGECVMLREMIITHIKESDEWWFKELAPLKVMQNSMEILMDRIIFNDHMLDRVPEEGVSRLTTHRKESSRDHLQRYGLSMLLNTMHLGTPIGDRMWDMQVKQIENATSETLAFGVDWHYLNHVPYVDDNAKYRTDTSANAIDDIIRKELDQFACLVKDVHSAEMLMDDLDTTMVNRGEQPADMMVWPFGAMKYCSNQPFYMTGKVFDNNRNFLMEQMPRKIAHKQSRGFRVGNHNEVEDPHFRQRTIGGFNVMHDRNLTDVPKECYRTSMLDRFIYSEKEDGWVRIEYKEAASFTGLYTWNGDSYDDCPVTPLGEEYFGLYGADTWGTYLEKIGKLDEVVDKIYHDIHYGQSGANALRTIPGTASSARAPRENAGPHAEVGADEEADEEGQLTNAFWEDFRDVFKLNEILDGDEGDEVDKSYFEDLEKSADFATKTTDEEDLGSDDDDDDGSKPPASPPSPIIKPVTKSVAGTRVDGEDAFLSAMIAKVNAGTDMLTKMGEMLNPSPLTPSGSRSASKAAGPGGVIQLRYLTEEEDYNAYPEATRLSVKGFVVAVNKAMQKEDTSVGYNELLHLAMTRPVVLSIAETADDGDHLTLEKIAQRRSIPQPEEENEDVRSKHVALYSREELTLSITGMFHWIKNQPADRFIPAGDSGMSLYTHMARFLPRPVFPQDEEHSQTLLYLELLAAWGCVDENGDVKDSLPNWMQWKPEDGDNEGVQPADVQSNIAAVRTSLCRLAVEYAKQKHSGLGEKEIGYWLRSQVSEIKGMINGGINAKNGVGAFAGMSMRSYVASRSAFPRKGKASVMKALSEAEKSDWVQELADVFRKVVKDSEQLTDHDARRAEANDAFTILNNSFKRVYAAWVMKQEFASVHQTKDEVLCYDVHSESELKSYVLLIAFLFKYVTTKDENQEFKAKLPTFVSRMGIVHHAINTLVHSHAFYSMDTEDRSSRNDFFKRTGLHNSFPEIVNYSKKHGLAKLGDLFPRAGDASPKVWIESLSTVWEFFKTVSRTLARTTAGAMYHDHLKARKQWVKEKRSLKKKKNKKNMKRETIVRLLKFDVDRFGIASAKFWKFCIRNNIPVGIGVLMLRPNQTYVMGSGIYAHGHGKSGITAIGHQKFRLGSDAARDLIYGQYTNYHKTLIHDKKKVIIVPDILPKKYVGGNGHEFWDPNDEENDVDEYHRGRMTRDIFACAVPINFKPHHFYFDITGQHHESMEASMTVDNTFHYPSAPIYRAKWKWIPSDINPLNRMYFSDTMHSPKFNTLVFQNATFEFEWNSMSKGGTFSKVILEKGHWGERVYEGCGKVRRGNKKYFEIPGYLSTKTIALGV
jgi:hypothetical protein